MSIFHLIIILICLFSIFPLSTTSSYSVSYIYLLPSSSCPMSVYHLCNISPLNTFYLFSACPLKLQLLCFWSSNYHYSFAYSFSSICLLSSNYLVFMCSLSFVFYPSCVYPPSFILQLPCISYLLSLLYVVSIFHMFMTYPVAFLYIYSI